MTPSTRRAERRLALGGLLTIGVSFGFARYGYGLFLPEIRRDFDLSVGAVGLIGSTTYGGYLLALGVVALAAARVGPRLLIGVGGVSAAVGMGLVAVAPGTGVLAVGLVLAGTSAAWAWAPYSDAVDLVVAPARRQFVLALIPAGTAVGTAVAGPLALVADGAAWRAAWVAMALSAVLVTVFNLRVVPKRAPLPSARREPRRAGVRGWFLRRAALPLYAAALSYGVIGAFYWNYATEALAGTSGSAHATTVLFWTLMGVAGTTGMLAGALFARLGLRRSSRCVFVALAAATALLALAPGSVLASSTSAVLYGPAFMAASSLLAVWSHQVFPERPTSGLSATLLALGAGTVVGPASLGALAAHHDLRTGFLATAGLALATALVRAPGPLAAPRRTRHVVPALSAERADPLPRPGCPA